MRHVLTLQQWVDKFCEENYFAYRYLTVATYFSEYDDDGSIEPDTKHFRDRYKLYYKQVMESYKGRFFKVEVPWRWDDPYSYYSLFPGDTLWACSSDWRDVIAYSFVRFQAGRVVVSRMNRFYSCPFSSLGVDVFATLLGAKKHCAENQKYFSSVRVFR